MVSRLFFAIFKSSITLTAREHENGLVSGDDPNGLKMVCPAASIHQAAQPTSAFWRITHLMIYSGGRGGYNFFFLEYCTVLYPYFYIKLNCTCSALHFLLDIIDEAVRFSLVSAQD